MVPCAGHVSAPTQKARTDPIGNGEAVVLILALDHVAIRRDACIARLVRPGAQHPFRTVDERILGVVAAATSHLRGQLHTRGGEAEDCTRAFGNPSPSTRLARRTVHIVGSTLRVIGLHGDDIAANTTA